ncbi:MAG: restriction endonuclease [Microbacteriaceae bacterium]|nr:restriction endonuclease [Microbacteriaceae bacterium]
MATDGLDYDLRLRLAAFGWLSEQQARGVSEFDRVMLCHGFEFEGERVPLVDWAGKGIRNPRRLRSTLSIRTTTKGTYPDTGVDIADDEFEYHYQARSTEGDNTKLRRAYELGDPLIYFHGIRSGWSVPLYPVYVIADDPAAKVFTIDLSRVEQYDEFDPTGFDDLRRYAPSTSLRRLHQPVFRAVVMHAYENQCSVCRLRHPELLDAAHIVRDRDEHGFAHVTNGLALCKIHHAAYDRDLLGIRPDYHVAVNHRLLDEIDGPMLRHGLQEMHDTRLHLPRRRVDRPSAEGLAARWQEFTTANA